LKNGKKLVWSNSEPILLLSFLLGDARNAEGVRNALSNFRELLVASNTPYPCDHACLWSSIVKREADFAIVGDWLFPDLEKQGVSKDYVLESLPEFFGKCASLPYSAFFPDNGGVNGNRLSYGKRLVLWLSSAEIQGRVQRQFLQKPCNASVNVALWPAWMRPAIATTKECINVFDLATPEFWAASSIAVRQMSSPNVSLDAIAAGFSKIVLSSAVESSHAIK
jgi:hypothetical protein